MTRPAARRWLAPTFAGAVGSTWIAVTLLCLFGPTEPLLGGRFANWVIAMLVATPLALLQASVLCVADVAMVRVRELPTGLRACWLSGLAPIVLGLVYETHPPGRYSAWLAIVLATVLPMLGVGFGTRFVFGRRCRP